MTATDANRSVTEHALLLMLIYCMRSTAKRQFSTEAWGLRA